MNGRGAPFNSDKWCRDHHLPLRLANGQWFRVAHRIFVCVLKIEIAKLAVTGVPIW